MTQLPTASSPQRTNVRLLAIALGLALVAVVLVNVYIGLERRGRRERSFTVFVLNRSVAPGDKLRRNDVDARLVPESFRSAFAKAVSADSLANLVGEAQRFRRPAPRGDLLAHDLFASDEQRLTPLAPRSGRRLVALGVSSRSASGALVPGTVVDIEAPFATGGRVPIVLPVMEQVKVLAVGHRTVMDDADAEAAGRARPLRSFRTITIEVEPWDATYLSMIDKLKVGDFELHVRNATDQAYPKTDAPRINPEVMQLLQKGLGGPLPGPAIVMERGRN